MTEIHCRIITVSDRAAAGEYEDRSGPAAAEVLAAHGLAVDDVTVVPDDVGRIQQALREAIDAGAELVLTTGGTGVGPRDVTPEATAPLLAARLEGVEQAIRERGLPAVPTALLTRGLVGITSRDASAVLVVNAPGSPGGAKDAANVIAPLTPHLLGLLRG